MKKVSTILGFIMLVYFASAQQNAAAASAKKTTPTVKVDSKPSTINTPVTNSGETKACCVGKTAAQCNHDSKNCMKGEKNKAACCPKGGSAQTCNHGAAEKNAEDKK